jgi:hypothetical protein
MTGAQSLARMIDIDLFVPLRHGGRETIDIGHVISPWIAFGDQADTGSRCSKSASCAASAASNAGRAWHRAL